MTKTQIQVPEELFREIRAFAKAREWSLAETFRRGAELLLEVYAGQVPPGGSLWRLPISTTVGWKGLSARQLREVVMDDAEPELSEP
jgi:hypothetical protein